MDLINGILSFSLLFFNQNKLIMNLLILFIVLKKYSKI